MIKFFTKPGIIIQGPLISKGRVPRSESIKIPDLKETDVVEFNCVDQIIEICEKYSKNFPIVIATWQTEDKRLISRLEKIKDINVSIILLEDITPKIPSVGGVVSGNHKFRQIYSTLKGAQKLLSFDCTHLIKLRTDMSIDVDTLWKDFKEISSSRPVKLLVPSFSLDGPSQVPDIYYVCKIKDLINFFPELLSKKHWFFSIHNELFYRWLNKEKRMLKPVVKVFGDTSVLVNIYVYAWNFFFAPASYKVFKSITWRGEKYPVNYVSENIFYDFFKNNNVINKKTFNLQSFSSKVYKKFLKLFNNSIK
ncbi:hypothetical protein OAK10_04895 [Candidatus Pelagibacter sp.]|nr:hypothetical protein [Candidatus Pelagibacter sp.]